MKNIQIGIAGHIASGKTTIARVIAQDCNLQYLSFGGILKQYCLQNNIVPSRTNLQSVGHSLTTELGQRNFMHWVMENSPSINWKNGIVLDGFRHENVYREFKQIFPQAILVFCDCSQDSQIFRICQRDKIPPQKAKEIISHISEQNVTSLKKLADFVFTPQDDPKKLVEWIINRTQISSISTQRQISFNDLDKKR